MLAALSGAWAFLKGISGMFSIVPGWVWASMCAGLLTTSCIEKTRFEHLRDKVVVDQAQGKIDAAKSAAIAADKALTKYAEQQKVANDALQNANKIAVAARIDAGAARVQLNSLSDTITDLSARRSATIEAADRDARTARKLLDSCSKEYLFVAERADGHYADSLKLFGWPTSTPR